jgi:hypothetical protein
MDERMRAEVRTSPSKKQPKVMRRGEYADWSNAGAGSAGGFPDKKDEAAKSKEGLSSSGCGGVAGRRGRVRAHAQRAPAGGAVHAAVPFTYGVKGEHGGR